MPVSALGLLILAAALHAGWNLLLKNTDNKYILLGWGLTLGSLISLPVLILRWPVQGRIWPYALAGGLWIAMTGLDIAARMRTEEAMLASRFGEPYRAYMRRTGRLFPRIGRGD
jgi:protein-S-isoprenylcysteine O-methyltransferase Ste14